MHVTAEVLSDTVTFQYYVSPPLYWFLKQIGIPIASS